MDKKRVYCCVLFFILAYGINAQSIASIRAALIKAKSEEKKKSVTSSGISGIKTDTPKKVIWAYLKATADMDCKISINKEVIVLKANQVQKIPVYQENINYNLFWEEMDYVADSKKIELSPSDKGKEVLLTLPAKEQYKIISKRSEEEKVLKDCLDGIQSAMVSVVIDENKRMETSTLKDFEISKYEVIVAEYATFIHFTKDDPQGQSLVLMPHSVSIDRENRIGINWSHNVVGEKHNNSEDFLQPVVHVSWEEANHFCEWLSKSDKNYIYRLPTSEEWLYAASCQQNEAYGEYPWNDNQPIAELANVADASLAKSIKYKRKDILVGIDDSYPFTSARGQFEPNCLGLYDMGGNVAEWCSDDFINTDTNVKDNSLKKKYKGGSYYTNPDKCKLNANFGLDPKQRHCGIGFRVVRQVRF